MSSAVVARVAGRHGGRMRTALHVAALAAAGVLACAPVCAAPGTTAPLPRYSAGDTFVYDNGRVERFARATANAVVWRTLDGREYTRHRNFVLPLLEWRTPESVGTRRVVAGADEPWPLARGRTARYRIVTDATIRTADPATPRRRRTSELWSCSVGALAPIAVRAGTFDAWEIRCDRYSPRTMRVIRRDVWHYAPDVGHYVRRESVDLTSGRRAHFELAAALSGRDAHPRRVRAILAAL